MFMELILRAHPKLVPATCIRQPPNYLFLDAQTGMHSKNYMNKENMCHTKKAGQNYHTQQHTAYWFGHLRIELHNLPSPATLDLTMVPNGHRH